MSVVLDHMSETVPGGTEQLVVCHDRATGMRAVIAVDDTTLGPGLGGVRWMPYPDEEAAVAEACRLARGMTLKNALAGIPYGGAKSVILRDGDRANRRAIMRAFGRFVKQLGGAYVPGVDMGTTIDDLAEIGRVAPDVSCDHEDPSPWTALGVFAGIEASVAHLDHTDLKGVRVAVQGAGHVGSVLAALLGEAGAEVVVADVDDARAARLAADVGGRAVDPAEVLTVDCDVLAPCATARVVDHQTLGALSCRVVAGGANDVLADHGCAAELAARGVTYVPDFLLNAGGVIQIHALRAGWGVGQLRQSVLEIGGRAADVLDRAAATGRLPVEVAEDLASERLGRTVTIPV
jgi:leucine dehydrogenase